VTSTRSRGAGHTDPVARRSLHALLLPVLLAVLVGACIGQNAPAAVTPSPAASAVPSAASSVSAAPSSEAPSVEPSLEPSLEPTETPEATPTATPTGASASPSGSGSVAGLDGCTGTDSNREFFANAATRYPWPVYCATLPARWVVNVGSFGSGKLDISYKGPSGTSFELHQGAVCAAGVDCYPTGTDAGTTAFGDRTASLVHVEDGGLVAIVDRGKRTSWMAIGHGLDDVTFASFLGALIRLD